MSVVAISNGNRKWQLPVKRVPCTLEWRTHPSIICRAIKATNFELKLSLLFMVQHNQLSDSPTNDPNLHLSIFIEFCDTLKCKGVELDVVRLRTFSVSLRDRARAWLQSLPWNSITTWDELKKAFLDRCFAPSKITQLGNQITCFRKNDV